ncbi:MAG: hypothetical protein KDD42_09615 [Bdellovibrionales bacterium]|nr:hypothetical protein [Bdellovibrionales bacterium]
MFSSKGVAKLALLTTAISCASSPPETGLDDASFTSFQKENEGLMHQPHATTETNRALSQIAEFKDGRVFLLGEFLEPPFQLVLQGDTVYLNERILWSPDTRQAAITELHPAVLECSDTDLESRLEFHSYISSLSKFLESIGVGGHEKNEHLARLALCRPEQVEAILNITSASFTVKYIKDEYPETVLTYSAKKAPDEYYPAEDVAARVFDIWSARLALDLVVIKSSGGRELLLPLEHLKFVKQQLSEQPLKASTPHEEWIRDQIGKDILADF